LGRWAGVFDLKYQTLDGKNLLVAEVRSSQGQLHALMVDPEKPEYYVRRGATTFYARPEELTAVIEARASEQNRAPDSRSFLTTL
jgi:hypothetical protein